LSVENVEAEDPLMVNVTLWFSGAIEYFDGIEWQNFMKPTMALPEGTYRFRFSDQNNPPTEINITITAPSIEKTVAYIRLLKSDGLTGQPGGTAKWWDYGGSKNSVPGLTDDNGVLLCVMDGKHTDVLIEVTYEDATAPFKRQNPTTNSFYIFQMTKVTVELRNHAGEIIPDNSTVNYYWPYGGTERVFGVLCNGRASKDLLMPNPPGFVYLIKDFQKSRQQIGPTLNTTVVFRTGKVVDGGFGCDIYWQYGGPQASFYDGIELLPGNFYFKDVDTGVTKNYQVKAGQILNLNTGTYTPPPAKYYLTVKTEPEGIVTIEGEGWYTEGTQVTLSAPDPVPVSTGVRYKFLYWDVDGTQADENPITVVMDANHTATAHYRLEYYLTVLSPFGTVGGEGWYPSGSTAYATLNTGLIDHGNGTRRIFVNWTGDASGSNYAQSDPIIMDGPKTAVANWKTQHLLTVVTDPANLTPQPTRIPAGEAGPANSWWYDADTLVTLTAQTVTGYTFNYWDVDGASQGSGVNPITVAMDGPHTTTAHYTVHVITFTLKIETTTGGTTNPAPGTYTYSAGTQVQVTAIPSNGYIFDHWELNGTNVGTATTYTVTMNANYVLKAFFKTAPTPPTVSISPMTATILVGQQVTFTSTVTGGTPPYTYQWLINNNPVLGATSNTFTFIPTTSGTYYITLKITDASGAVAQSEPARVTVSAVPVGGYSVSIVRDNFRASIVYSLLMLIFGSLLSVVKAKKER